MISERPILPGRLDITYTYVAPMPSGGIELSRRFAYPTERFDLLLGEDLRARARWPLRPNGVVDLAGRTYRRFTASRLAASDELAAPISAAAPSSPIRIVGLGGGALVALAILVVPLVRRRRMPSPNQVPA
jgi:hypothetical protein